jgi:hypothetical protein
MQSGCRADAVKMRPPVNYVRGIKTGGRGWTDDETGRMDEMDDQTVIFD